MTPRKRFDWAELLERTKRAEKAVLDAGTISAERRGEILRTRAALLALPVRMDHETDSIHNVVILRCGADRYAIPLSELVEVIRQPRIAIVPHAPEFVAGLLQVRGEIRPAYHLQALLGNAAGTPAMPPVILLATNGSAEFGIGVDAVEDIRQVPPDSRTLTPITRGHAGWMTDDLVPCLAINTLIPEQN